MRTEYFTIERDETLVEAFKNKGIQEIESNVILDKTITGIGATYWELHLAKRPSIIIDFVYFADNPVAQHYDTEAYQRLVYTGCR